MHSFETLVPAPAVLRAIARAQAEPLHDDIKRMEILYMLMEATLDVAADVARIPTEADKIPLMSLVSDIREDICGHIYGKSTAVSNAETLECLQLFYQSMELRLSAKTPDERDFHTPLVKAITQAALDFYVATTEGNDFKKAWAKKGALPQQSPFTAFTITNEIMLRVMPKIEESYPDVTPRAWGEKWDAQTARKLRSMSALNFEIGAADAVDLEGACKTLGNMSQYIAGVRSAFTRPEQLRAENDLNCRVLQSLSTYLSPYMPRMESAVLGAHSTPDNVCSMSDFRRAHMAPRPL